MRENCGPRRFWRNNPSYAEIMMNIFLIHSRFLTLNFLLIFPYKVKYKCIINQYRSSYAPKNTSYCWKMICIHIQTFVKIMWREMKKERWTSSVDKKTRAYLSLKAVSNVLFTINRERKKKETTNKRADDTMWSNFNNRSISSQTIYFLFPSFVSSFSQSFKK